MPALDSIKKNNCFSAAGGEAELSLPLTAMVKYAIIYKKTRTV